MRLFRRKDPNDGLAERQRALADLFVDSAQRIGGVAFDYTAASVIVLEAWADNLWDPTGPPPPQEEYESNATLMGSYLGEVIIRTIGGQWVWDASVGQPGVEVRPGGVALVLNRAFMRQVEGRAKSLVDYYKAVEQIKAAPDA